MAIYVADLRSLSGWTERFNTGNAAASLIADGFRFTHSATGPYGFSWNTIDADGDRDKAEVLAKVRHAAYPGTGTYGVGVFARGATGADCYAAMVRLGIASSSAAYTLCYEDDSSGTPLDFSSEVSVGTNTWVWIKLRVNGTDIKSKAWLDGTAEPDWQYEGTDATYAGAGWVGILTSHADGDPYDVAYFAVATNGDSLATGSAAALFLGVDF